MNNANDMKHTHSAGGVVMNTEGDILVVNQHGLAWSLPKGHIEGDEDTLTAAKREIYEESGISQLLCIRPLGSYERHKIALDGGDNKSELKTITMFFFTTNQHDLHPIDPENPEARWIKKEAVADLLTHHKDKEFFVSIMSYLYA